MQQQPINPSEFENPYTDNSGAMSLEEQKIVQQEQQIRVIMNAIIMGA